MDPMSYTASCSSRTSIGTVSWQAACLSFALLFSAAVNAGSTPANDALKSSIGIAGRSGEIALSTRDATREATEPQVSEIPNAVSVWYRFQPFVRGPLTLRLKGAPSDSRIVVYEQRGYPLNFSVLTAVGSGPSVTFPTALRTTYVIGVLSTESGVGDFTLAWEQDVAEDNDIDLAVPAESVRSRVQVREFDPFSKDTREGCVKAGVRRILAVDFEIWNRGTEDLVLGEDYMSPWGAYSPAEDWTRFYGFWRIELRDGEGKLVGFAEPGMIPSLSGTARWNPEASDIQRFGFRQQGLRGGWYQWVQSHWSCQFVDVTDLAAGEYTATIVLDPYNRIPETREDNNSTTFPVLLTTLCTAPPANDNRENAQLIEGTIVTVLGDSSCATREIGERRHIPGSPSDRSIWYQWVAPYSGRTVVSTEGSSFDTLLEVQGPATSGANGPSIISNDDADPSQQQSRLQFQATAGESYWFVVDGYNEGAGAEGGSVVLTVNPAGNNAFAMAEPLNGDSGETAATNQNSDREPGEPAHGNDPDGHSVWYRWVATRDGLVTFQASSDRILPIVEAYVGDRLDLLKLARPDPEQRLATGAAPDATVAFNALAGRTYYIAVDAREGKQGPFQLSWSLQNAQARRVSVSIRRNGVARLTVEARDGQVFEIFRSTNLEDWKYLGHLQIVGTSSTWNDGDAPQMGTAFYRIVQK